MSFPSLAGRHGGVDAAEWRKAEGIASSSKLRNEEASGQGRSAFAWAKRTQGSNPAIKGLWRARVKTQERTSAGTPARPGEREGSS